MRMMAVVFECFPFFGFCFLSTCSAWKGWVGACAFVPRLRFREGGGKLKGLRRGIAAASSFCHSFCLSVTEDEMRWWKSRSGSLNAAIAQTRPDPERRWQMGMGWALTSRWPSASSANRISIVRSLSASHHPLGQGTTFHAQRPRSSS